MAVQAITVENEGYADLTQEYQQTPFWTEDDSSAPRLLGRLAAESALDLVTEDKEPWAEPNPNAEFDFKEPVAGIFAAGDPKLEFELTEPCAGKAATEDSNPVFDFKEADVALPAHHDFNPECEYGEPDEANPDFNLENINTVPRDDSNPEFEFTHPSPQKSGMILYPWEIELLGSSNAMGSGLSQTSTEADEHLDFTHLKPPSPPGQATLQFCVELKRRHSRPLGIETRALLSEVTGALRVEAVKSGGLVAELNAAVERSRCGHQILTGDFILEVNGISGSSDLLYKAISQTGSLQLLVMRLTSDRKKRRSRSCRSSRRSSSMSSLKEQTASEV